MAADKKLRPFATALQWEKIVALDTHGSGRLAAEALGLKGQSTIYRELHAVQKKAAAHGYHPAAEMHHQTAPGFSIKRISTLRDLETGESKIQWQIAERDKEDAEAAIRAMAEGLAEALPTLPPIPIPDMAFNDDLMSVMPWGDPHFGLYTWKDEVGADYDLDIAKRDLCGAVDYLVSQSPSSMRCVIINLGDFYHTDNAQGTTTKGTRVDADSRITKVIQVGVAAMLQCINSALTRHKVVEVINAIGNHDEVLSMTLSIMLSHIYEDEPRVIIHDQPTWRHYLVHGKVLIGVVHGDKTKDRDLPAIMATERPEEWGRSEFRYWYRGHQHHDSREEFTGCQVEQFRTMAPSDAYSTSHGWLSGQDMKLIVHHKEFGEVARSICSVQMLKSLRGG